MITKTTYRFDIEYLKWLIHSLEFVSYGVNGPKTQDAIIIISEMLHKRLIVCYEMLISNDISDGDYTVSKKEAYRQYLKNCDKFCNTFRFNIKPDLEWEHTEDEKCFTVDDARLIAYETIQNYQKRIIALYMAVDNCLVSRVGEAKNILHEELYNKLNHAYGVYFMFALGGDIDTIKIVKTIAYDRYLSESMAIMTYHNTDFDYNGSHWTKDEEDFREDIKKKYL